jgi:propionyl-CoA carboxylase alpha chain
MKILVATEAKSPTSNEDCSENGNKTSLLYSTVDRNAPHVKFADEAVLIGESPSNQSYLLGDKIIEVANRWVDAIHPVWILSENADFAESRTKQHHFIGPKSKAIHIMGVSYAKEAVKAYNIPWFPA